jgi:hypothetical protein
MLTPEELVQVAALKNDTAFVLLLDAVQAGADDLLDLIEESESSDKTNILLGHWRGLRSVLRVLRTEPNRIAGYIEALTEQGVITEPEETDMITSYKRQPPEYKPFDPEPASPAAE